ncbi:imidazolonepropionase-like amidohydrolase [Phenylobacterium haematophilum]|uniref:Imidazolonepropionase-like amidohydrolase n=1 Tax=Phenylobacterium haematophilum TaxID=98513 RepID=A0A839ZXU1_9CAUL|nr:amidohydrolase family protein [Phenylobacterium haematophilum]MBB3890874.1 imidazolonepropionase-like amidohydrolase [Phenylobacterium haematophilum]
MRRVSAPTAAKILSVAIVLSMGASGQAGAQAQPATVIHAGALLDKPGQAPRGASTLIVRGGKIEAVRDGFVEPEAGAKVVDLRDQFVLPGLIDSHVHIFSDDDKVKGRMEAPNRDLEDDMVIGIDNARRTLEAGFTTIRDVGSDIRSVTALRDGINNGLLTGPTILAAGRPIAVTGGHGDGSNNLNRDLTEAAHREGDNVCNGAEDCRRAVRAQISQGADVIKFTATGGVLSNVAGGLGAQMFDDEMKAIVDTAHMFGRKVAAHAHGTDGVVGALNAGVDSIEHGTFGNAQTDALFKKTGAYFVPTMLAPKTALDQARAGARSKASLEKAEIAAKAAMDNHRRAIANGVKIAFGTDTGVSAHGDNGKEFALMVSVGMTPTEAIKAATVNAADLLGRSSSIGTLEAGKDADIIAVAKSPLSDVTQLEHPTFVMHRGAVAKIGGQRAPFPPN